MSLRVIAAAVLLVRRTGRRLEACQPDVLEVAWLRGQLAQAF